MTAKLNNLLDDENIEWMRNGRDIPITVVQIRWLKRGNREGTHLFKLSCDGFRLKYQQHLGAAQWRCHSHDTKRGNGVAPEDEGHSEGWHRRRTVCGSVGMLAMVMSNRWKHDPVRKTRHAKCRNGVTGIVMQHEWHQLPKTICTQSQEYVEQAPTKMKSRMMHRRWITISRVARTGGGWPRPKLASQMDFTRWIKSMPDQE